MCVAISTISTAQINNFDFILTCKKKEKSMRKQKYSSTNVRSIAIIEIALHATCIK